MRPTTGRSASHVRRGALFVLSLFLVVGWRAAEAQAQTITTVAGNGTSGFAGDGSPATAAALNNPGSVAVDAAGNVFINDNINNRIRRVDAVTGIITTYAGNGSATIVDSRDAVAVRGGQAGETIDHLYVLSPLIDRFMALVDPLRANAAETGSQVQPNLPAPPDVSGAAVHRASEV